MPDEVYRNEQAAAAYLARVTERNLVLEAKVSELLAQRAVMSDDRYNEGFAAGVNAMLREVNLHEPSTLAVVIGMCGSDRVRTLVAEHLAAVYAELTNPPF